MNEEPGSGTTDPADKTRLIVILLILLMCCGCGGMVVSVLAPLGEMVSLGKTDYQRQCDAALGPATPTGTQTVTTAPSTAPTDPDPAESPSPRPSTNPYAMLRIDDNDPNVTDRDRVCSSAMQSAPYQDRPLRHPNTGPAVVCAADLALRYPEAGGTADMAEYARDVVYSASMAASTGLCTPTRAPAAVAERNCGDPNVRVPAVVLPPIVGYQGYCGQLVEPSVASAGDLVFWEYRGNAATKVGIALGPGELVTVDSGKFVRLGVPEGAEVQIKRVLGGAL